MTAFSDGDSANVSPALRGNNAEARDETLAALAATRTLRVALLLFPDVEILDFAGPYEVFSVASRVARRHFALAHAAFEVDTIAVSPGVVRARHGLDVVARYGFETHPTADLLLVPGGVVDAPLAEARTIEWVRHTAANARLTASVCTGAFVLGKAGLLRGRTATTHWEDLADLRTALPDTNVVGDVPFVDAGTIVTSAGISAGIGMSLHLVSRIMGQACAVATARQMQYDWQPV
ncbi:DJ-1/PfpI family protein [Chitinasiproducens palmae]|uniref:DJ-1/PfpI family protein n=1 Tax=Chitinasiproducens palmae TaxID=1770053 RepID=A0A1H2PJZ8_9BURK|nr:DJ-1/PfpI family protein [Chitinasiproducens palmae]SDV46728.1 DJ-1/PfpI family protein [Chitinasiproducens palmae]